MPGLACGWPPLGSDAIRNTARPTEVTEADAHAAGFTARRNQTRPSTSENTSSVTRIDCTTDMRPLYRAMAWSTKLPTMARTPKSQRGFRIK